MKQPYIHSAFSDLVFILSPPFVCLSLVILFPGYFNQGAEVAGYSWLLLIVLIDVSHVYSTLFRTYLDKDMMSRFKTLFLIIPIVSFVVSVLVYTGSQLWFWRCMAYLAVFHFIRQQYGFLRLYERKEQLNKTKRWIDGLAIYSATLYPLLYWHFSSERQFNWFVQGDFILSDIPIIRSILGYLYILILLIYLISELSQIAAKGGVNVPKNLLLSGTALSWFVGIVWYNSDLSFTLLNVVAHGVPYMALIWMKGRRKLQEQPMSYSKLVRLALTRYGLPLFILIMTVPALLEEGVWDVFVWHEQFEHIFGSALNVEVSGSLLNLLVPLLAVPQLTHYILDGFIWKVSQDKILNT